MRVARVSVPVAAADHMWDKHRVEAREVREILLGAIEARRVHGRDGKPRYGMVGRTYDGRVRRVIFEVDDPQRHSVVARVVTAYPV